MCTVTLVALDDGVRLVCNRDERRARPAALPPQWRATPAGGAIAPIDPVSRGTWIGASDCGFAAVLLNRTPRDRQPARNRTTSRGAIVASLLECGSFGAAVAAAAALDCRRYEPFTVVVAGRSRVRAFTSGTRVCSRSIFTLAVPLLFTSSSLGDHLVVPARRALFDELVAAERDRLAGQFRFHRHQWALAPHLSVRMERDDAATVSRTTIDLAAGGVRIEYEPIAAGAPRTTKAA
jgi:uncharacterized protein with NRDE domain